MSLNKGCISNVKITVHKVKIGVQDVNLNLLLTYSDQDDEKLKKATWSSGGVVVKLLACGARGPEFNSRSCHYNFRDWLSPASKSGYG